MPTPDFSRSVFVLTASSWEEQHVLGIYESRELAELAKKGYDTYPEYETEIEEFALNDAPVNCHWSDEAHRIVRLKDIDGLQSYELLGGGYYTDYPKVENGKEWIAFTSTHSEAHARDEVLAAWTKWRDRKLASAKKLLEKAKAAAKATGLE